MSEIINIYSSGKIYKIVDIGYNKCYYGSTVQELSSRMSRHRSNYKRYNEGRGGLFTAFNLFDEFGVENCKIELVELFPCNIKSELTAREGFYIKNNECVNKNVAGRCRQQYRIDNKEQISTYNKTYRDANKETIASKKKAYRLEIKSHLI
jgi:hypothetical protein